MQHNGTMRCIRSDFIDQPIIEYESLDAMVRTNIAAYDTGASFIDADGYITYDPNRFNELAAKMNPAIDWWEDPELA